VLARLLWDTGEDNLEPVFLQECSTTATGTARPSFSPRGRPCSSAYVQTDRGYKRLGVSGSWKGKADSLSPPRTPQGALTAQPGTEKQLEL